MATAKLTLTSPLFAEGSMIPAEFTCDGDNASPPLAWQNPPDGTRSFTLILDDPDAPRRTFTHWVLFDVPGDVTELPKGVQGIGKCGRNDFQQESYGGPCPPPNHDAHRYYFHLYALDVPSLGVEPGALREQVEQALAGHVLGEARLMARFRRTSGRF